MYRTTGEYKLALGARFQLAGILTVGPYYVLLFAPTAQVEKYISWKTNYTAACLIIYSRCYVILLVVRSLHRTINASENGEEIFSSLSLTLPPPFIFLFACFFFSLLNAISSSLRTQNDESRAVCASSPLFFLSGRAALAFRVRRFSVYGINYFNYNVCSLSQRNSVYIITIIITVTHRSVCGWYRALVPEGSESSSSVNRKPQTDYCNTVRCSYFVYSLFPVLPLILVLALL